MGQLGESGVISTASTPMPFRAEAMSRALCSSPRPMMWSMTSLGVSGEMSSATPRSWSVTPFRADTTTTTPTPRSYSALTASAAFLKASPSSSTEPPYFTTMSFFEAI